MKNPCLWFKICKRGSSYTDYPEKFLSYIIASEGGNVWHFGNLNINACILVATVPAFEYLALLRISSSYCFWCLRLDQFQNCTCMPVGFSNNSTGTALLVNNTAWWSIQQVSNCDTCWWRLQARELTFMNGTIKQWSKIIGKFQHVQQFLLETK